MSTQVRFGESVSGLLEDPAGDFMNTVAWRSSGAALRNGKATDLSVRTIGMCWKQQCLERRLPKLRSGTARFYSLDRAIDKAAVGSLLLVLDRVRQETSPLRRRPGSSLKKQARQKARLSPETVDALRSWLADNRSEVEKCPFALLASCELLALYGSQFPSEVIGSLWRVALAGALEQTDDFLAAAETEDWQDRTEDKDQSAWLRGGLLPWICGVLFDEVKGAPKLARAGRTTLNDQLLHITDESGVPVGEVFSAASDYLALWTDGLLVARLFDQTLMRKESSKRLGKTLRRLTANVSRNGVQGCSVDARAASEMILRSAEYLGVSSQEKWLRCLEDSTSPPRVSAGKRSSKKQQKGTSGRRVKKVGKKDIPSWQSDDTDSACLRTLWAPDASVATLLFNSDPVRLDMAADGVPVLSGDWEIALAESGEELEFSEAWECVCWHSVDDVDYCELQFEFEGGPKINRLLMLSRQRQFAVFADVISATPADRIDLVSLLPLANGVTIKETPDNREVLLDGLGGDVRVFPLALPQDRGIGTEGSIGLDDEDGDPFLAVSQASATGGLFSPVVLDWSPERRKAPAEWRQLTVSEAGEIDRTGSAAFRLKVGDLHLVLYRALKPTERYRTFLGYLSEGETVIGEFGKTGEIEELVTVE